MRLSIATLSTLSVLSGAMLVALSPSTFAQTQTDANPVVQAVRRSWDGARQNVKASATLMPEANYSFRPIDSVRTFGQMLAHVAGANYVYCSAAKGEASPHAEDDIEKTATSRAAIIRALDESLAYCDTAFTGLDDRKAAEIVRLPFGGGNGARVSPLIMNISHLNEHYGNLVTYFRIKGIVPPSSRPQ